ncbi:hypothetical protein N0V84_000484 [Fusarium piperis]|uniref:Uncharacterized protein n=1 Tax=Fusarium piperis TaxID=1435070 RepID=A0A9W8WMU2_9HYPO|nr:hypothetical protein N0V84_000484 [Fusarium piperis]
MTRKATGLEGSIWSNGHTGRSPPSPSIRGSPSQPPPPRAPSAAPNKPALASATRLTPAQAFLRFEQTCQRLRWKFLDLQTSYQRAMSPEEFGFTRGDAEQNFKVDFHEFYVWIEQAVVLLLLIFGITVSKTPRPEDEISRGNYVPAGHAYHHNVLKALEDESCPVYSALGKGEVNQALWKAKELRNRWKDASEGKETPPLKMYDLTWIVTEVLQGLQVAYNITSSHVEQELAQQHETLNETTVADGEWDWMVEPMDWEP